MWGCGALASVVPSWERCPELGFKAGLQVSEEDPEGEVGGFLLLRVFTAGGWAFPGVFWSLSPVLDSSLVLSASSS